MTYTEILFEPDAAGFVQVTVNRPHKLNALSNRVMAELDDAFQSVEREYRGLILTGGFIDIAQKARKVVFCGTLAVRGGKPKFVPAVRQITFSGANAVSTGQEVLYITEAAMFRLTAEGLQLEEVAPSLDPGRDVVAKMAFRQLLGASLGTLPADCFPAFQ